LRVTPASRFCKSAGRLVYSLARAVTFSPKNISSTLQLEAAEKHLYVQQKNENADRCLSALGTPLDAKLRVEHAG
jgi:hypothetical protein